MNKLQETISSLSDLDYESLNSIENEIIEAMGFKPTENELSDAIHQLFLNGQLTAYIYKNNSYIALTDLTEHNLNTI
jgi:hypothetical protein